MEATQSSSVGKATVRRARANSPLMSFTAMQLSFLTAQTNAWTRAAPSDERMLRFRAAPGLGTMTTSG